MRSFDVECQINANDDRMVVSVQAASVREAWQAAERIVRSQVGQGNIRGCIVVGVVAQ